MENASDAILMAGAMLIFVIAITVAMTVFSQTRATVDIVLYQSDPTNYYEELEIEGNNNVKNRVVGLETIIPTLYKYYKENYTVVFLDDSGNGIPLYTTKTNPALWSGNTTGTLDTIPPIASKYKGINEEKNYLENKIPICSFDVDEETKRHEPWTGSPIDYKNNLDCFLEGKTFNYPNGSGSINYSETGVKGFINAYSNRTFIETIGEYSTNLKTGIAAELNQGIRDNKNKRVIVYRLSN